MRRLMIALALVSIGLPSAMVAAKSKDVADATISLSAGSAAAGIGVTWGSGTLTYHGKSHHISVEGLDVGSVGASKLNARGSVYHLKSLDDFNGTYAAAEAEATVGGGGAGLTMRNQNGVVVRLGATTRGAKLQMGPSGVKMELKR
jgi:hypothetical protein